MIMYSLGILGISDVIKSLIGIFNNDIYMERYKGIKSSVIFLINWPWQAAIRGQSLPLTLVGVDRFFQPTPFGLGKSIKCAHFFSLENEFVACGDCCCYASARYFWLFWQFLQDGPSSPSSFQDFTIVMLVQYLFLIYLFIYKGFCPIFLVLS